VPATRHLFAKFTPKEGNTVEVHIVLNFDPQSTEEDEHRQPGVEEQPSGLDDEPVTVLLL
jgi:hypothetical protein